MGKVKLTLSIEFPRIWRISYAFEKRRAYYIDIIRSMRMKKRSKMTLLKKHFLQDRFHLLLKQNYSKFSSPFTQLRIRFERIVSLYKWKIKTCSFSPFFPRHSSRYLFVKSNIKIRDLLRKNMVTIDLVSSSAAENRTINLARMRHRTWDIVIIS